MSQRARSTLGEQPGFSQFNDLVRQFDFKRDADTASADPETLLTEGSLVPEALKALKNAADFLKGLSHVSQGDAQTRIRQYRDDSRLLADHAHPLRTLADGLAFGAPDLSALEPLKEVLAAFTEFERSLGEFFTVVPPGSSPFRNAASTSVLHYLSSAHSLVDPLAILFNGAEFMAGVSLEDYARADNLLLPVLELAPEPQDDDEKLFWQVERRLHDLQKDRNAGVMSLTQTLQLTTQALLRLLNAPSPPDTPSLRRLLLDLEHIPGIIDASLRLYVNNYFETGDTRPEGADINQSALIPLKLGEKLKGLIRSYLHTLALPPPEPTWSDVTFGGIDLRAAHKISLLRPDLTDALSAEKLERLFKSPRELQDYFNGITAEHPLIPWILVATNETQDPAKVRSSLNGRLVKANKKFKTLKDEALKRLPPGVENNELSRKLDDKILQSISFGSQLPLDQDLIPAEAGRLIWEWEEGLIPETPAKLLRVLLDPESFSKLEEGQKALHALEEAPEYFRRWADNFRYLSAVTGTGRSQPGSDPLDFSTYIPDYFAKDLKEAPLTSSERFWLLATLSSLDVVLPVGPRYARTKAQPKDLRTAALARLKLRELVFKLARQQDYPPAALESPIFAVYMGMELFEFSNTSHIKNETISEKLQEHKENILKAYEIWYKASPPAPAALGSLHFRGLKFQEAFERISEISPERAQNMRTNLEAIGPAQVQGFLDELEWPEALDPLVAFAAFCPPVANTLERASDFLAKASAKFLLYRKQAFTRLGQEPETTVSEALIAGILRFTVLDTDIPNNAETQKAQIGSLVWPHEDIKLPDELVTIATQAWGSAENYETWQQNTRYLLATLGEGVLLNGDKAFLGRTKDRSEQLILTLGLLNLDRGHSHFGSFDNDAALGVDRLDEIAYLRLKSWDQVRNLASSLGLPAGEIEAPEFALWAGRELAKIPDMAEIGPAEAHGLVLTYINQLKSSKALFQELWQKIHGTASPRALHTVTNLLNREIHETWVAHPEPTVDGDSWTDLNQRPGPGTEANLLIQDPVREPLRLLNEYLENAQAKLTREEREVLFAASRKAVDLIVENKGILKSFLGLVLDVSRGTLSMKRLLSLTLTVQEIYGHLAKGTPALKTDFYALLRPVYLRRPGAPSPLEDVTTKLKSVLSDDVLARSVAESMQLQLRAIEEDELASAPPLQYGDMGLEQAGLRLSEINPGLNTQLLAAIGSLGADTVGSFLDACQREFEGWDLDPLLPFLALAVQKPSELNEASLMAQTRRMALKYANYDVLLRREVHEMTPEVRTLLNTKLLALIAAHPILPKTPEIVQMEIGHILVEAKIPPPIPEDWQFLADEARSLGHFPKDWQDWEDRISARLAHFSPKALDEIYFSKASNEAERLWLTLHLAAVPLYDFRESTPRAKVDLGNFAQKRLELKRLIDTAAAQKLLFRKQLSPEDTTSRHFQIRAASLCLGMRNFTMLTAGVIDKFLRSSPEMLPAPSTVARVWPTELGTWDWESTLNLLRKVITESAQVKLGELIFRPLVLLREAIKQALQDTPVKINDLRAAVSEAARKLAHKQVRLDKLDAFGTQGSELREELLALFKILPQQAGSAGWSRTGSPKAAAAADVKDGSVPQKAAKPDTKDVSAVLEALRKPTPPAEAWMAPPGLVKKLHDRLSALRIIPLPTLDQTTRALDLAFQGIQRLWSASGVSSDPVSGSWTHVAAGERNLDPTLRKVLSRAEKILDKDDGFKPKDRAAFAQAFVMAVDQAAQGTAQPLISLLGLVEDLRDSRLQPQDLTDIIEKAGVLYARFPRMTSFDAYACYRQLHFDRENPWKALARIHAALVFGERGDRLISLEQGGKDESPDYLLETKEGHLTLLEVQYVPWNGDWSLFLDHFTHKVLRNAAQKFSELGRPVDDAAKPVLALALPHALRQSLHDNTYLPAAKHLNDAQRQATLKSLDAARKPYEDLISFSDLDIIGEGQPYIDASNNRLQFRAGGTLHPKSAAFGTEEPQIQSLANLLGITPDSVRNGFNALKAKISAAWNASDGSHKTGDPFASLPLHKRGNVQNVIQQIREACIDLISEVSRPQALRAKVSLALKTAFETMQPEAKVHLNDWGYSLFAAIHQAATGEMGPESLFSFFNTLSDFKERLGAHVAQANLPKILLDSLGKDKGLNAPLGEMLFLMEMGLSGHDIQSMPQSFDRPSADFRIGADLYEVKTITQSPYSTVSEPDSKNGAERDLKDKIERAITQLNATKAHGGTPQARTNIFLYVAASFGLNIEEIGNISDAYASQVDSITVRPVNFNQLLQPGPLVPKLERYTRSASPRLRATASGGPAMKIRRAPGRHEPWAAAAMFEGPLMASESWMPGMGPLAAGLMRF